MERPEDGDNRSDHREIVVRRDHELALVGVRRLEHDRGPAMLERLHGRFGAHARGDDVAIARACRRIHQHVVAVEDATTDHAVTRNAKEETVVARHEHTVERDVAVPVLRDQHRLAGSDLPVERHGLHSADGRVPEQAGRRESAPGSR